MVGVTTMAAAVTTMAAAVTTMADAVTTMVSRSGMGLVGGGSGEGR